MLHELDELVTLLLIARLDDAVCNEPLVLFKESANHSKRPIGLDDALLNEVRAQL